MATIKEMQGAYPDVPRELLRPRTRRNKQANRQIIDALVAALQNMVDADELTKDDYDQALAALALARGEA